MLTKHFQYMVLSATFQAKQQKRDKIARCKQFLKFYIEIRSLKKSSKFQLADIDGENPKIKDKEIHNFSIRRLGKKRKLNMSQPIETVIVGAQQNVNVAGGLNLAQIEIEDDRIINIFKKYKNVLYKVTPLGLLFPASLKMIQNKYLSPGKN